MEGVLALDVLAQREAVEPAEADVVGAALEALRITQGKELWHGQKIC